MRIAFTMLEATFENFCWSCKETAEYLTKEISEFRNDEEKEGEVQVMNISSSEAETDRLENDREKGKR